MKKISGERGRMGLIIKNVDVKNNNIDDTAINNKESVTMSSISNLFSPIKNSRDREIVNKWEKITGKDIIFVSFISDPPGSSFYSERAKDLVSRLDSLGYDYSVTHYKNDRNYYQNCCFKPNYIESKLLEFRKDLVWIDGDTNLKNSMDELTERNEDFDIGLVSYNGDITGFVASPLLVRNTDLSKELIRGWNDHCTGKIEEGTCELDHDALKHSILPLFRNSLRIKLIWNDKNDFHDGHVLSNVNSDVPFKRDVLSQMAFINRGRPFNYNNNDYNII
jgi:hypothetical protein